MDWLSGIAAKNRQSLPVENDRLGTDGLAPVKRTKEILYVTQTNGKNHKTKKNLLLTYLLFDL